MSKILEVKNLSVNYGTVKALKDASFHVEKGEIISMVGPNGAGKSTALNAVSGVLTAKGGQVSRGEILFNGKSIKGLRTDELVKKEICLVPEGRRIFTTMSVLENLEMGAFTLSSDWNSLIKERMEKVFEIFPILKKRKNQKAGTFSSGEQQMLAIGRALMLKPKLLLLDEPSLGLSPNFVAMVFQKLGEINKTGISILMVEQNVEKAFEICNRGYVFDIGRIALEGEKNTLLNNERIKKVFLGG